MTKKIIPFFFFLLLILSTPELKSQTPIYLDSTYSIQERVDDLLSRMTLDEKIGQMTQADHAAVNNIENVKNYHLGSLLSGGGSDPANGNSPEDWANLYDTFQAEALKTRLSIPLIYGIDAVHGHSNVTGAVIFPHNIGLGATRNPELIKEISRITAVEVAATGIDWTFAPCIAVPRDERWGRTYEGFGETPELAQLFAGPAIEGLQNNPTDSTLEIAACAKHFIGDGGTSNGIDQGNTDLTEEELRAIHLPGYIDAVESGVYTVMASYSSWNGKKMHGQKYLLTDVLKDELGFDGFVISDWAGIDQLPGDYSSDIEQSINAGVDMVMVPNNYVDFITKLNELVQQGKITEERVNDAVRRILTIKFKLDLFERPYTDKSLLSKVGSLEHRAVGRQSVRESMVLLKKNDNVLPLPKSYATVFVAGKHADNLGLQCGGWTIQWQGASGEITQGTTILQGLKKVAPNNNFIYDENGNFGEIAADYAIVVIGEEPYAEGQGDREDLSVDKEQVKLVRKLKQRGIPVITVLISGRPMIINPVLHNSDAFIAAWLPGTEGDGIAEVITGNYQPSGILPMTWPESMEQIPINYGDENYNPLFEYGYGITNFDNSESGSAPILNSAMITEDGKHIELAFNKSMNSESNTEAVFSALKNGSEEIEITNFFLRDLDNKVMVLELNDELNKEDEVLVSYSSGNLKAEDGGVLESFEAVEVINYLKYTPKIFMLPGRVEAEDYADMSGVQTESTSDNGGGLNVGWIDDDDWLEYNCKLENTGTYMVNFRIASESSGGNISLVVNGEEKFKRDIPVTNGWQNWKTVSTFTDFEKGDFTIRINANEGGFNLNWFEFVEITNVNDNESNITDYKLYQNYPNPFNPSTNIRFDLNKTGSVRIDIYDMLGQKVRTILNEKLQSGRHNVRFTAKGLTSGLYFYRIKSGEFTSTKKMLLMK